MYGSQLVMMVDCIRYHEFSNLDFEEKGFDFQLLDGLSLWMADAPIWCSWPIVAELFRV